MTFLDKDTVCIVQDKKTARNILMFRAINMF